MRRLTRRIWALLDHDTGYGPVWWFVLIIVVVAAIELSADGGYLFRELFVPEYHPVNADCGPIGECI